MERLVKVILVHGTQQCHDSSIRATVHHPAAFVLSRDSKHDLSNVILEPFVVPLFRPILFEFFNRFMRVFWRRAGVRIGSARDIENEVRGAEAPQQLLI